MKILRQGKGYTLTRVCLWLVSFFKNYFIMKQCCKFVKGVDITDVVDGLGVDVCNAIETGIIQDTSASVFHNMMKDLGEVGQVARDPFDIIEYDRAYSKFRKYVNDKEKEKNNN